MSQALGGGFNPFSQNQRSVYELLEVTFNVAEFPFTTAESYSPSI